MLTVGNSQITLLERLCNAMAVSGNEGEVRKMVLDEVAPYADEIKVDALGNVLVMKRGASPRVLLDAHMDEVGFMIVEDEGEGVYRFEIVGGIDVRHLVGKHVVVGKERSFGVIGARPVHLAEGDDLKQKIGLDSLRMDLGAEGRATIGDYATFATKFKRVGPSLFSKAIDDRIGVAILIELLKHAPANIDLCLSFSVQEEVGLRGATVAAHYFNPDFAIAVDSTPARDLPSFDDAENVSYNTKLGLGPAIYIANSSTLDDPALVRHLEETAQRAKIPYQLRQPAGGGTNAGAIQKSRAGVRVVSVSVPHRYTHSPISVARVDDWKNTLNLLFAALNKIDSITGKRKR